MKIEIILPDNAVAAHLVYITAEENAEKAINAGYLNGLEDGLVYDFVKTQETAKNSDIIRFGSYPQTEDGGIQPIEWLVVKKEGDKALLVSRYALDCKAYNQSDRSVTWRTSSLRTWLNTKFLSTAFTPEEQEAICCTPVANKNNFKYRTQGGTDTHDNIFLLSIEEAVILFAGDEARLCAPTAYAKAMGCSVSGKNSTADNKPTCLWWLRSPGGNSSRAACVGYGGSVGDYGFNVNDVSSAVRPALWVNLDSEIFESWPTRTDEA